VSPLFCPPAHPGGRCRASEALLKPRSEPQLFYCEVTPPAFRRAAPPVTVPASLLLLLVRPALCPAPLAPRLVKARVTERGAGLKCNKNNNSRRSGT
jgi:hypothetical protein